MDTLEDCLIRLRRFVTSSAFADRGAVMTDLDGTAVHEIDGRALLSRPMTSGLEAVHATGRPVMLNTLRFPLSVMRVFGSEWRRAGGGDLPLVSLKGSLVGTIVTTSSGAMAFEEIAAFPLTADEIGEVATGIRGLVDQRVDELLVFFYPRDWRVGEQIWAASPAHAAPARAKYTSATRVFHAGADALVAELSASQPCMVLLLVDAPEDRLMAYQHTERSRFVTHIGVDKRTGAQALAAARGVDLAHSIGAGDAETDTFLEAVGFATIVGNQDLSFKGLADTVRLPDPTAFGTLLAGLAGELDP